MPLVLPDVVGKQKSTPVSHSRAIELPDVLHPGRTVSVQSQPVFGFQRYGVHGYTFGKSIPLDNTPPKSQGPKIRQILANGKLV